MAVDPSSRLELAEHRHRAAARRERVRAQDEQFLIDREARTSQQLLGRLVAARSVARRLSRAATVPAG